MLGLSALLKLGLLNSTLFLALCSGFVLTLLICVATLLHLHHYLHYQLSLLFVLSKYSLEYPPQKCFLNRRSPRWNCSSLSVFSDQQPIRIVPRCPLSTAIVCVAPIFHSLLQILSASPTSAGSPTFLRYLLVHCHYSGGARLFYLFFLLIQFFKKDLLYVKVNIYNRFCNYIIN